MRVMVRERQRTCCDDNEACESLCVCAAMKRSEHTGRRRLLLHSIHCVLMGKQSNG